MSGVAAALRVIHFLKVPAPEAVAQLVPWNRGRVGERCGEGFPTAAPGKALCLEAAQEQVHL